MSGDTDETIDGYACPMQDPMDVDGMRCDACE